MDNTIEGNDLMRVGTGIMLSMDSHDNLVSDNCISGSVLGISVRSTFMIPSMDRPNIIAKNIIRNSKVGIHTTRDRWTHITNNTISDSLSEGQWGIALRDSMEDRVSGNLMVDLSGGISLSGMVLGMSMNNMLANNRIENIMGVGLELFETHNNDIRNNLIYNSTDLAINITGSYSNVVTSNSIIRNKGSDLEYSTMHIQARDDSSNDHWDLDGIGNHWSDWISPDADRNGIVDEPYLIFGGEEFDRYPLVRSPVIYLSEPWNLTAIEGNGRVSLEWSVPLVSYSTEVDAYKVYRASGDGEFELLAELGGTSLEYIDTDVLNNVEYHYRVSGINKYGEGRTSIEVLATPDGNPPMIEILEPVNGTISGQDHINISWNGTDDVDLIGFQFRLDEGNWTEYDVGRTATISNLSEGGHILYLAAIDRAGNRKEINSSFIVDLTPPMVDFTNM